MSQEKMRKIGGTILIFCAAFGFFYVMNTPNAKASDVMVTVVFFGFGLFLLAAKIQPKK